MEAVRTYYPGVATRGSEKTFELIDQCVAVMGDNIKRAIHQYYDNSYENIGAWNSYTWSEPTDTSKT